MEYFFLIFSIFAWSQGPTCTKEALKDPLINLECQLPQIEMANKTQEIWKLLNGTNLNPKSATYAQIESLLKDGQLFNAIRLTTESPESSVANGVVRRIFTPLAGREPNFSDPSGDFVATWMIATLTHIPLKDLLLGDSRFSATDQVDETASTQETNALLSTLMSDAQIKDALKSRKIVDRKQPYIGDPASRVGPFTSLQYGRSIFEGGTNRRPVKKLVEDFLCIPSIENIMNFQIMDHWVGRDIPRAPGEDPYVYQTKCVGCHAGIDSTRGAFSGFDFIEDKVTFSTKVTEKMNNGFETFPQGKVVVDDQWEHTGYLPIATDKIDNKYNGVRPLIEMFLESPQFYRCIVERTHQTICPTQSLDSQLKSQLAYVLQKKQNINDLLIAMVGTTCVRD